MSAPLATAESAWVAERFGLGAVRTSAYLARGAMGEVHRLDATTGRYAVKRAFWAERPLPAAERAAEREVELVERALRVGVRAPRPVRDRAGNVLAADELGTVWRVHTLVTGRPGTRDDETLEAWVLACGAAVHRLRVPAAADEAPDPFRARVDVDWHDLHRRVVGAAAAWAPLLRRRLPLLEQLSGWATGAPVGEVVLCHGDLTGDNVVVARDGVRWLLDWEDCGPCDPAREVGATLLHHLADDGALGRLASAYGAAGGIALPDGPELFAGGMAAWLNFLGVQVEALLDPRTSPEHRRFAASLVPGLLEHLPHPAALAAGARLAARAARDAARTMGP